MAARFLVLALVFFIAEVTFAQVPLPTDGASVLRQVLEARNNLLSGEFEFKINGWREEGSVGEKNRKQYDDTWTIYLDGRKLRGDFKRSGGIPETYCFGCYGDNSLVTFIAQPVPHGRMSLLINPAESANTAQKVLDPRVVGLLPIFLSGMMQFDVGAIYTVRPQDVKAMVAEELNGIPTLHVSWNPVGSSVEMHLWVDKKSYEALRVEGKWINESTPVVERVSSVLGSMDNNVGYPKLVTYEMYENDNLVRKESVSVEVKSLNQPLNKEVFSLNGIDILPANTPVSWGMGEPKPCADGESMIWDGEEIICEKGYGFSLANTGTAGGGGMRYAFIALNFAVVMGILAAICYRRLRANA